MSQHRAPDGRRFRTYVGTCVHLPPCWCARCECGTKLTAHDDDEEMSARIALDAMATDHAACRASA